MPKRGQVCVLLGQAGIIERSLHRLLRHLGSHLRLGDIYVGLCEAHTMVFVNNLGPVDPQNFYFQNLYLNLKHTHTHTQGTEHEDTHILKPRAAHVHACTHTLVTAHVCTHTHQGPGTSQGSRVLQHAARWVPRGESECALG